MTTDQLEEEIGKLSQSDRSELLHRLGLISVDSADDVEVEIDDLSEKGLANPCTVFRYPDGSETRFDIIATVRTHSISIGHPAVLFAIRHWTNILKLRKALELPDVYDEGGQPWKDAGGELWKKVRAETTLDVITAAERNLQRIAKALVSIHPATLPEAIDSYIKEHGLDREDTFLYKAWKFLGHDEIKNIKNLNDKLKNLEEKLRHSLYVDKNVPKVPALSGVPRITINRVIDFLKSDQRRLYLSSRRSWPAMRNAFVAWRFNQDSGALRTYRYRAGNSSTDVGAIDSRVLWAGTWVTYRLSELADWRLLPVIRTSINE